MTLAHDLLLLAYTDTGRPATAGITVTYGLAAALLYELQLSGRIAILEDGRRVAVTDTTPHPDPFVEEALARLRNSRRPRSLRSWVHRIARLKRLHPRMIKALVDDGLLRDHRRKALGFIPDHRYLPGDPEPEQRVRAAIDEAVLRDSQPDSRLTALIALARSTNLRDELYPRGQRRHARRRMEAIAQSAPGFPAVRRAFRELTAALVITVLVASFVSAYV